MMAFVRAKKTQHRESITRTDKPVVVVMPFSIYTKFIARGNAVCK